MGSKLATGFLAGVFFTFILDFFFILGLFLNYIEAHEIDVYYNILFADHQNFFLFFTGVIIFGYITIFFKNSKISALVLALCLVLVNLVQIPSIGKSAGEMMFKQENKIITEGRHRYIGHIVYEGRDTIWFYDDELENTVEIKIDSTKISE
jgi:uncharacterized membrane protein